MKYLIDAIGLLLPASLFAVLTLFGWETGYLVAVMAVVGLALFIARLIGGGDDSESHW